MQQRSFYSFLFTCLLGYGAFVSLNAQQVTITSNPSDGNTGAVSVCEGVQISFSGSWNATNAVEYEFLYDDGSGGLLQLQARSANNSYSEVAGQGTLSNGDEVLVRAWDTSNNDFDSGRITVTILPMPLLPIVRSSVFNNVFCEGESVSFSVDAITGVSSYTFYINDVLVQDPSSDQTLGPFTTLNDGDQIKVEATNGNGCTSESTLTMSQNIINDAGVITLSGVLDTGYSICEGENSVLIASSRAATVNGVLQNSTSTIYQWYSSIDGINWIAIAGATSESYQPLSLFNSTYFRRNVVSEISGKSCEEPSNELYVEVISTLEPGSISNGDQTVCVRTVPGTLTLINAIAPAGRTYTYQWQSAVAINATYTDISGQTGTTLSFSGTFFPAATTYYRVAVTANPDGCVAYTSPVPINVEQEHTIQQVFATSLEQEICYGGDITPIVFEFGGGATDLIIEPNLTAYGLTATLSNTNRYVITGTPSGSIVLGLTTTSTLGDFCETKTVTYTIEQDPAPTLPDNIYWGSTLIWSQGMQVNTIDACSGTSSALFTAEYLNAEASAVNTVEWELIDTGPPSPGFINASTGELTWAPGFGGTAFIRARGKSNDPNCSSAVSEWTGNIQIGIQAVGSSSLQSYNTIETEIIEISDGVNSGAEPTCEITASTPNTYYVPKYSDGSPGIFVSWDITVVQPDPLTPIPVSSAGTINSNGLVDWAPGFWGSVEISAVAEDCDGNTSTPTIRRVDIPEFTLEAVDISIASNSSLPSCRDETAGATTQFVSNLSSTVSITWSIDTVTAGAMDPNTGLLTWAADFFGGVWVTATTAQTGGCQNISNRSYVYVHPNPTFTLTSGINSNNIDICSGDPIANVEFLVEGAVDDVITTGLPQGLTETVIETGLTFDMNFSGNSSNAGERYMMSLSGQNYAYTTSSIGETAAHVATQLANAMQNNPHAAIADDGNGKLSFTWLTANLFSVGYTDTDNSFGSITMRPENVQYPTKRFVISGTPLDTAGTYNYTLSTSHSSASCRTTNFNGTIRLYEDPAINLTSGVGTNALVVCDDAAVLVTYNITGVNNATIAWVNPPPTEIQTNFDNATGVFSISGTPNINSELSQIYEYTLSASSTSGFCNDVNYSGSILIEPNDTLALTSSTGTDSQEVCTDDTILPITYTFGGGASSVFLSSGSFPPGISGVYQTTKQVVEVIISGNNASAAGETYTLTVNGIAYTYTSVTAGITPSFIADQLAAIVNANADVTATDDGNAKITIEAVVGGTYFTVFRSTGNNAQATIGQPVVSKTTGVYTITGTPTVQVTTPTTYSYTLTTSGGSCTAATATGQIVLNPLSIITLDTSFGNSGQTVCDGTAIDNIVYDISGEAQGVVSTGLPPGVNGLYNVASNTFTISGTPVVNDIVSRRYYYTIRTTGNANLCSEVEFSGSITVTPNDYVNLASSTGTESQELCPGETLENIVYRFGGGATDIALTSGSFPPGISGNLIPTTQIVSIDFRGNNTASSGESYSLIVNGTTYTYTSVAADETPAFVADRLATLVNANTAVSATDDGSGVVTIEALVAGNSFTLLRSTSSDAQISIEEPLNLRNTGEYVISGTPTEQVSISKTYSYTLTTIGNSCNTVSVTSQITLNPASIITLDTSFGSSNQTVCSGTSISDIVFTVSGEAQGVVLNGLPTGVTGNYDTVSKVLTISGTPSINSTVPQLYEYTVETTGNSNSCSEVLVSGAITVEPNHSIVLISSLGTDTQAVCKDSPIENIVYEFRGGATNLTLTAGSLPPGISGVLSPTVQQVEVTLSGSNASAIGETYTVIADGVNYTVTSTLVGETPISMAGRLATAINGGANISAMHDGNGKIMISATNSGYYFTIFVSKSSNAQIAIAEPVYVTTNGIYTITGTPTENLATSKTYSYTLTTSGGNCGVVSVTGEIVINPLPAITLASGVGTNALTTCDKELLPSVEYLISNGSQGAFITWLSGVPSGLQTNYDSNAGVFSITGTPTTNVSVTTTYGYEITTSGSIYSCNEMSVTGSITIEPAETLQLVSGTGTDAQKVCLSTESTGILSINNIIYQVGGGATGGYVTNLPTGLSFSFDNSTNQITISGTVTNVSVSQIFTYMVYTQGSSCQTASVTGTVEIVPTSTLVLSSAQNTDYQIGLNSVCDGAAITNISYTFGGGATAVRVDDLPAGLNWTVSGTTVEISGILAVSNETPLTYNYSVTTEGSFCNQEVTLNGQIEVSPLPKVDTAYVIANDITNLSCNGSADGSIVIPSESPAFDLRISGDQNDIRQTDHMYLINDPDLSDVFTIEVDGISYTHTVIPISAGGRTQNAEEVATALIDEINQATGNSEASVLASLQTSTGTPTIILSAKNPGTPFTVNSSSVAPGTSPSIVMHANITPNRTSVYTYSWSGPNGYSSNDLSIYNLQAGTYELTVKVNDCVGDVVSFNVTEPDDITVETLLCNGAVVVTASGGVAPYRFNLYDRNNVLLTTLVTSGSETYLGLTQGSNYIIEVFDSQCANSKLVAIELPFRLNYAVTAPVVVDDYCNDNVGTGYIELGGNSGGEAFSGGSNNFSYSWTGPSGYSGNTRDIYNLIPGVYTVTVTDIQYGCFRTESFTVDSVDSLVIDVTSNTVLNANGEIDLLCAGDSNGIIEVIVSGGLGAYSYSWSYEGNTLPGATTNKLENLVAGTYELTVSQAAPAGIGGNQEPCRVARTFVVNDPAPITVRLNSGVVTQTIVCQDDTDTEIKIQIFGGTPPFNVELNNGSAGTFTILNNELTSIKPTKVESTYNVSVQDYNSCTPGADSDTAITFESSDEIIISADIQQIDCVAGQLGSISLNVVAGVISDPSQTQIQWQSATSNYYHTWSEHNGKLENIEEGGEYQVIVTQGSCELYNEIVQIGDVSGNILYVNNVIVSNSGCNGDFGKIELDIQGGYPPYSIEWQEYQAILSSGTGSSSTTTSTTSTGITYQWVTLSELADNSIASDLSLGTYRAIVTDGSYGVNTGSCGGQVTTRSIIIGSSSFELINFSSELDYSSCSQTTINASVRFGIRNTLPNPDNISYTPVILLDGGDPGANLVSLGGDEYQINNVPSGDHLITISTGISSGTTTSLSDYVDCEISHPFTIDEYVPIDYSGPTLFEIDPCTGTGEVIIDPLLVTGGVPFEVNGVLVYNYNWIFTPLVNDNQSYQQTFVGSTIIGAEPGSYELTISDSNQCLADPITIEVASANGFQPFSVEGTLQEVSSTGSNTSVTLVKAIPPSCEEASPNGQIGIAINGGYNPYTITWLQEVIVSATDTTSASISLVEMESEENKTQLQNLSPGRYKLILESEINECEGSILTSGYTYYEEYITVPQSDELYVFEGPTIDNDLCLLEQGYLTIRVFDSSEGQVDFYYNSQFLTSELLQKTDNISTYLVRVNNPVSTSNLELVNSNNCILTVPISIVKLADPDFEFTSPSLEANGYILNLEEVTFTNDSQEPYVYSEWIFGDGESLIVDRTSTASASTVEPIRHAYGISGTYFVTLRNYNNLDCFKSVTKEIVIGKGYNIIAPSVFSPNEDGINDVYRVLFSGFRSAKFTVYSAFGNLLYQESVSEQDISNLQGISLEGWDGSNGSSDAPYFIYQFTGQLLSDGSDVTRTGTFILLK